MTYIHPADICRDASIETGININTIRSRYAKGDRGKKLLRKISRPGAFRGKVDVYWDSGPITYSSIEDAANALGRKYFTVQSALRSGRKCFGMRIEYNKEEEV